MNERDIIVGVAALLFIVGGVLFAVSGGSSSGGGAATNSSVDLSSREAKLAQCLKDKGVIFYGAFWCPHCQAQKKAFGNAAKLLPYVECSTPDGHSQNSLCSNKKVQSYPTWDFPDGTRETGEQTLDHLAQKAGCAEGTKEATATPEAAEATKGPVPPVLPQ